MVDLGQFRTTYITESTELSQEMEELLLQLNPASPDTELLHAIFRCAHSIKGGGGAFGFTDLVQFTHGLEALLDELRNDRLPVTEASVDVLLKSVDVIRAMIDAAKEDRPVPPGIGDAITQKVLDILKGSHVSLAPSAVVVQEEKASVGARYRITMRPKPTLFLSGNEPLLLLREIASLGDAEITLDASRAPLLESFDTTVCYWSWDIQLRTDHPEARIRSVFEFVEDQCDVTIEAEQTPVAISAEGAEEESDLSSSEKDPSDKEAATGGSRQGAANAAQAVSSIRVDIDKIDRLVNMVGEIVIAQAMISAQVQKLSIEEHLELVQGLETLSQHTRELQEAVMAVRMQPVKSVFSRMTRLVRDLSRDLQKDVRIETRGETTEIDKTVIEQLSDPLTHMIRNSVDHGIESPEQRRLAGKDEQGLVILSADQRGGRILIEIEDDGKGIQRDRVREKAIEKGIISADAVLTNEEIDALIFHAGFSTAQKVTNVSGRGVGMDVVRKNIETLGGTILLHNRPGDGLRFTISLPLTLAILDGMIIRVGSELYIIPISSILESLRPSKGDVSSISNGCDVVTVRGEFIPILYLSRMFNIGSAEKDPLKCIVILVETGQQKVGLAVDEMIGQQQVVIKSIEENSDPIPGVSGATILGDGKVSFILDVARLYELGTQMHHQEPQRKIA